MRIKTIEFGKDCGVLVTWLDESQREWSHRVILPIEVIGGIGAMVSMALQNDINSMPDVLKVRGASKRGEG